MSDEGHRARQGYASWGRSGRTWPWSKLQCWQSGCIGPAINLPFLPCCPARPYQGAGTRAFGRTHCRQGPASGGGRPGQCPRGNEISGLELPVKFPVALFARGRSQGARLGLADSLRSKRGHSRPPPPSIGAAEKRRAPERAENDRVSTRKPRAMQAGSPPTRTTGGVFLKGPLPAGVLCRAGSS